MVIPDWNGGPRTPKIEITLENKVPHARARPVDRLAATIIDIFVFLVPIYILLSAPLKRSLATQFILGAESDFFVTISALVLVAVILIVIYQTSMLFLFGTTLGKRLFNLRVVSMFEASPITLWDAFFRSWLWIAEAACLGLPWLSVFSDGHRRVLHDRATNTMVITDQPRAAASVPALWERSLVRAVFSFCLAIVAVVLIGEMRGVSERLHMEGVLFSAAEKEAGECEVVTQNMTEVDSQDHSRLSMAMSLYAAGLADRSCLEAEVEREVALQVPISGVTYLAQAFIYADDGEVSNAYLDRVCADAPGSLECSMSQLVSSWSDEDWQAVEEILRAAPKGSGYLEVWGIRHYMKQAQYASALGLLDTLVSRRELSEFSLSQRVKALFNNYREAEARVALQQAMVALPEEEGRDLGTWMCAQQLQNSCEALSSPACRGLPKWSVDLNYDNASETLARVLARECEGPGQLDFTDLSDSAESEIWRTFFRANLKKERRDRSAAVELFARVVDAPEAPELVRLDAIRRLAQLATPRQMDRVLRMWSSFESRESWVKAGNMLFSQLAEQKNADLALKVARHLTSHESLSPKSKSILLSMATTAGSEERKPASVKMREPIRQMLDSVGEEP